FLNRGVPEIEANRRGAQRVVGAVSQIIALLNEQECRSGDDQRSQRADSARGPKETRAGATQGEQTENAEHQQTRNRTSVCAATAGQDDADITKRARISDEQFAPSPNSAPPNQTR